MRACEFRSASNLWGGASVFNGQRRLRQQSRIKIRQNLVSHDEKLRISIVLFEKKQVRQRFVTVSGTSIPHSKVSYLLLWRV